MRVAGVVQPSYLPWLPFFERACVADVFVLLDDVEYSKNSFLNRNAIKTPAGRQMLTAPVLYKGQSKEKINSIHLDNSREWRKKQWKSIEQNYRKSPYWATYNSELFDFVHAPHERLFDQCRPIIEFLMAQLDIGTPMLLSSEIAVPGTRNEKLINICRELNATHFIVKPGTDHYHPPQEFHDAGIALSYLTYSSLSYPQVNGPFEANLSTLDYLLNCGPGTPPFECRIEHEGIDTTASDCAVR